MYRIKQNEVFGYKLKNGEFIRTRRWNNIIKGSGALITTLNDMKNFAIMLMNFGRFKSNQILKPETFELIWSPHYFAHDSFRDHTTIGLIFWVYKVNGLRLVEHTGSVAGFTATFDCFPNEQLAFFSMCNRQQGLLGRVTQRIKNRLIKVFSNLSDEPTPNPLKYEMEWVKKIVGYYGGYPGWLTSTRLYAEGGCEFKIFFKYGKLFMKALFGINKIPKFLIPTENPLLYYYQQADSAGDVFYKTMVGFSQGESGSIIECAHHFDRWVKKPFWRTFRLKLALWIFIPLIILLFYLVSL